MLLARHSIWKVPRLRQAIHSAGLHHTSKRTSTTMAAATQPVLFYDILPAPGSCPFAHRAWLALEELKVPYEHTLVDPANKPQDFKDLYASIVHNTDDSAKVPIIVDGDDKVTESLIAVEYLDAKHGGELLPKSPLELANVKLFVELFTSKYQGLFFKLLRATKDEVEPLKGELAHNLEVLDKYISAAGSSEGGAFFLGSRYTYADLAATPFVRRSLVCLPHFRDVDPRKIAQEKGLTRLDAWFEAVLARESCKRTGPSDEQIIDSFKKFVG